MALYKPGNKETAVLLREAYGISIKLTPTLGPEIHLQQTDVEIAISKTLLWQFQAKDAETRDNLLNKADRLAQRQFRQVKHRPGLAAVTAAYSCQAPP